MVVTATYQCECANATQPDAWKERRWFPRVYFKSFIGEVGESNRRREESRPHILRLTNTISRSGISTDAHLTPSLPAPGILASLWGRWTGLQARIASSEDDIRPGCEPGQ